MKSKLDDRALAEKYVGVKQAADDLNTVLGYLSSCLSAITERRRRARNQHLSYRWNREYESLHTAVYIIRLLLIRDRAEITKMKHDLFARGYETDLQILYVANNG